MRPSGGARAISFDVMSAPDLREAAAPTRLLDTLRHATRGHHEAIERHLTADGGSWTRDRYCRMLRMFQAVISPIETTLVDHLGGLFAAPPPTTRTERLAADLSALGLDPQSGSALWPSRALTIVSRAEAFGAGYVLQGSLLGGAVICRQMRSSDAMPHVPALYLELYGAELGQAWTRLCRAINAFGDTVGVQQRELTVTAAIRTFEACDAAFDALS
jgi:heme oxygenase (biliverdin-IX-beta and delta-forming)